MTNYEVGSTNGGRAKEGMMTETCDYIIPIRYIPFDIGLDIDKKLFTHVKDVLGMEATVVEAEKIRKELSIACEEYFHISDRLDLFIYNCGIGVFALQDDKYIINHSNPFWAKDYCETRKESHIQLCDAYHKDSELISKTIQTVRRAVTPDKHRWCPFTKTEDALHGISYVMTIGCLISKEKKFSWKEMCDLDKENLLVLLNPALVRSEDSQSAYSYKNSKDSESDVPYDFDISEQPKPINMLQKSESAVYISWSSVILCLRDEDDYYLNQINCLETDLQAIWKLTECLKDNLNQTDNPRKMKVSNLKKIRYEYRRHFAEFVPIHDSNASQIIANIKNELIKTSNLPTKRSEFEDYLGYLIDEQEAEMAEKQKRFAWLSEVLLFLIAFLQIAPLAYKFLTNGLSGLKLWPLAVLSLVAIVCVYIIIRKE